MALAPAGAGPIISGYAGQGPIWSDLTGQFGTLTQILSQGMVNFWGELLRRNPQLVQNPASRQDLEGLWGALQESGTSSQQRWEQLTQWVLRVNQALTTLGEQQTGLNPLHPIVEHLWLQVKDISQGLEALGRGASTQDAELKLAFNHIKDHLQELYQHVGGLLNTQNTHTPDIVALQHSTRELNSGLDNLERDVGQSFDQIQLLRDHLAHLETQEPRDDQQQIQDILSRISNLEGTYETLIVNMQQCVDKQSQLLKKQGLLDQGHQQVSKQLQECQTSLEALEARGTPPSWLIWVT